MKLRPTLKVVLTLNFLLVAGLPLLLVSLTSLHLLTSYNQKEISRKNLILAKSLAGEVDRFLEGPLCLLNAVSEIIEKKGWSRQEEVREPLEAMVRHIRVFNKILLLDNSGVVRIAAPFNRQYVGIDMSGQPYFQMTRRIGKPWYSPAYVFPDTGETTITLTQSFRGGMVVGRLSLAVLDNLIEKVRIGRTGYAAMADLNGTAIAHPDRSCVAQRLNIKDLEGIRHGLAGEEGTFRCQFAGVDSLVSVALVSQTGWPVVIVQTIEDAFAPVRKIRKIILLGLVLSFVFAAALAFSVLRRTLRPLSRLDSVAQKIAGGDYRVHSLPESYPEIDKLTKGFQGMSRAIEARERALRESRKNLEALFDSAEDFIFVLDTQGHILRVNPRVLERLGYSEETLLGQDVLKVHSPDRHEEAVAVIADIVAGRADSCTIPLVTKDGTEIPVETKFARGRWDGQDALFGISRDITERKEALSRIERSEKRFRDLFDSVSDLIYTQDLEGRFITANRAMRRFFGYEPEQLTGRKASDFMKPELRPFFETEYLGGLKERGHYEGITAYFTREGRKVYLEYHSNLVLPDEGEPYISGTARDVTERILAERRIKKVQEQLQQAQKMEAVGTLAGGISHDFNNLLQAIMGYTQIIIMGKDRDDPDLGKLKEIEKAAQRASELTRQLLTFSRKVESKLRPVDLNHEVRQVEKLLKRTIPKMIRIELHLQEEGLKIINADPAQMEQVMMNVAVNARDAMPEGGKLVIKTENITLDQEFCRTHTGATPGEYVLLSISDTGHGMERETVKHIFEPFYTTKETGKGTGLGLSMVYAIVKNHHGYIACASEPGEGTTFRIYFPTMESGIMEQGAETDQEAGLPAGNETILLVDDEAFLRDLGAEILGRFGYTVLQAENGENALEIYEKKRAEISLIVLDLIMPGMGGKKCLEEILRVNPRAKVVVASGYSINGSPQDVLDAGARGYIRKPYDLREMLNAIRKLLDDKD